MDTGSLGPVVEGYCFVSSFLSLRRRRQQRLYVFGSSRGSFMFPRYLQYLLMDFRQTFVTGASRDRDELIRFWGQRRRLYVFGSSVRAAVRACVRPSVCLSVCDSRGSFMFPRYLQYLLTDFRQTFVTGASRDRDELIRFWGQKSKVKVTA